MCSPGALSQYLRPCAEATQQTHRDPTAKSQVGGAATEAARQGQSVGVECGGSKTLVPGWYPKS